MFTKHPCVLSFTSVRFHPFVSVAGDVSDTVPKRYSRPSSENGPGALVEVRYVYEPKTHIIPPQSILESGKLAIPFDLA